jgi:hypothetical protein
MDYGHTLEFGSFIDPTSSAPQQASSLRYSRRISAWT